MDISLQPSLPPYGRIDREAVQCIASAAVKYQVPELLLHAILAKEGGSKGLWSKNSNGSYDLGLAQINTAWSQHFGRYGIRPEQIANNNCTNVATSAYILKYHWQRTGGDWFKAAISYHIGENNWTKDRYVRGYKYAADVVNYWWGFHHYVEKYQNLAQIRSTPQN